MSAATTQDSKATPPTPEQGLRLMDDARDYYTRGHFEIARANYRTLWISGEFPYRFAAGEQYGNLSISDHPEVAREVFAEIVARLDPTSAQAIIWARSVVQLAQITIGRDTDPRMDPDDRGELMERTLEQLSQAVEIFAQNGDFRAVGIVKQIQSVYAAALGKYDDAGTLASTGKRIETEWGTSPTIGDAHMTGQGSQLYLTPVSAS